MSDINNNNNNNNNNNLYIASGCEIRRHSLEESMKYKYFEHKKNESIKN